MASNSPALEQQNMLLPQSLQLSYLKGRKP